MKTQTISALVVLLVLCPGTLMAQRHTDRGALLGGVAGALAGAGIGEHNDNAGAGALIGGAVGLVTGAALGNSMDQEEARARAVQQHLAWQRSQAASISDVVTMTRNGLRDDIIINHVNQNGVQRRLNVHDVISLHQQGVSEAVISAMQRAPVGRAVSMPAPRYQAPVVVEQYHYVRPPVNYWYPYPHRPYHHGHGHRHHRPGVHWSMAVGR